MRQIKDVATARFQAIRPDQLLSALLISSLVVPIAIVAFLGWLTYWELSRSTRNDIQWAVEVAREHAEKVFDSFRLIGENVDQTLREFPWEAVKNNEKRFHERFGKTLAGLQQADSLIVLDEKGALVVATAAFPAPRSENFADRDYFSALLAQPEDDYVSRVQQSRVSGKSFFGWGHALRGPDGSFRGVVDIAISPDFFARFYDTLIREAGASSKGRVVTLLRDDGQILVRQPPLPGDAPKVVSSNPFFDAVRQNPARGIYSNKSVIDPGAPERLFAYAKVPGYPIYVVAGRSYSAIWAAWRRTVTDYLFIALPATTLLFLVTLAAVRSARRESALLLDMKSERRRRKSAEERLRQGQKMEAIGQLAGGVSHDFNNLLTIMQSAATVLAKPDISEQRREKFVAAIAEAVTRGAKLTSQLLAFARQQPLAPEVFDVAKNLRVLAEFIRPLLGGGIELTLELPAGPLLIYADSSQFDTAIVNLAVNARDAMNGEGNLIISLQRRSEVVSEDPQDRALDLVVISVIDEGEGIDPKNLTRIFEPFFTTKGIGKGTGLGLAQVFGFAKQSGGELSVTSEIGRGTTFHLLLPRARSGNTVVILNSAL